MLIELEQAWRAIGHESEPALVVGVSGGQDSLALLHGLIALRQNGYNIALLVVHVNHGLTPAAADWAAGVERFCNRQGVAVRLVRIQLESRANLEATARQARYACLAQQAIGFGRRLGRAVAIVTAHHQHDQAELLFLRLMRKAGVNGLAGMRCWDQTAQGVALWRPLLKVSRAALTAYAQAHSLPVVNDPSNANLDFDRNFIRAELLPRLEDRWANAIRAISASQTYCAKAHELNEILAALDLPACEQSLTPLLIPGLKLAPLLALGSNRGENVLRYWLNCMGLRQIRAKLWHELVARYTQGQSIRALLIGHDSNQQRFELAGSRHCVFAYKPLELQPTLIAGENLTALACCFEVRLSVAPASQSLWPAGPLMLFDDCFAKPIELGGYSWRLVRAGEEMRSARHRRPQALKELWRQWRIPLELRRRWPVLVNDNDVIVHVPGVGLSFKHLIDDQN